MKRSSFVFVVLFAASCTDDTATLWYGADHAPLKTPCKTTWFPLLTVGKLSCDPMPASPRTGESEFWSTELPTSLRYERADGSLIQETTIDYTEAFAQPDATYDEDGNIQSVKFPDVFPLDDHSFHYTYENGRHTGGYAMTPMGREAEAVVIYEDGRRASDGGPDHEVSRYHYRYEDGRLVAMIGGGHLGVVSDRPDPSMLAEACGVKVPDAVRMEGDPIGMWGAIYYFRDADGRIEHMLIGLVPGRMYEKVTYEWEGDRLVSATKECSEESFEIVGNHRRVWGY